MTLKVDLHIKFRAFGITFGRFDFTHTYPVVGLPVGPGRVLESFDQRGVQFTLSLVQA